MKFWSKDWHDFALLKRTFWSKVWHEFALLKIVWSILDLPRNGTSLMNVNFCFGIVAFGPGQKAQQQSWSFIIQIAENLASFWFFLFMNVCHIVFMYDLAFGVLTQ